MPKFFYIVRTRAGKRESGVEEGATQEEVVGRLQAKDLIIINVFPESKETGLGPGQEALSKKEFKPKHFRVTKDDLVLYCRQLATLLGAGVTILKSLEIISKQVSSRRLYAVIKDSQKNMEAGLSFHEAMAKHPSVFSELWVNLIESGEASGNLAMVLDRLATYLERNSAFRRKITSALIYPVILTVVGLGALLFLNIKIIPTFAELFKGFNIELPLLTRILVLISTFLQKNIIIIVITIAAGIFFLRKYIRSKSGRSKAENFLLKLPVFGEFFRVKGGVGGIFFWGLYSLPALW